MGFLRIFLTFLILSSFTTAQDISLQTEDIHKVMNQILTKHVEKKEISREILSKALKTYVDQFDPNRIYLLESEVQPYYNPSQKELDEIFSDYKKTDYEIFRQMNQKFQSAIYRARKIRTELENNQNLFKEVDFEPAYDLEATFPSDQKELQHRIKGALVNFILAQKQRYGNSYIDKRKAQVIEAYEHLARGFENEYLFLDKDGLPLTEKEKENWFAIHVLKALASSLDSHTKFFNPSEAFDMKVRLLKGFPGIGVVLNETVEGIKIGQILKESPADKSKELKVGDLIEEIDGRPIIGFPFQKVIDMLRGESGTDVTLLLNRKVNEQKKQIRVTLTRQNIPLEQDRVNVSHEKFGNGIIGIIQLQSFYQGDEISSEKDVLEAIKQLDKQGNLRGLILDLRNNSGGFLSQAIKVAGLFITNGVIVISKYSAGEEKVYRDIDSRVAYDGPLIVLTSPMTASAAEIVAQALQDYGVALVVGDPHTYGKGTIQTQTVTDENSTSFFKVTVGKYYTVSGKTPESTGVKADVVVPGAFTVDHIEGEYLEEDTIKPEFSDSLADVSLQTKPWYLRYYMPSLQKPKTGLKKLIPILQKNSQYRIEHSKNYQLFLNGEVETVEAGEESKSLKGFQNFGTEDLQLMEAINVLKDLIILHAEYPKQETVNAK